MLASDEQIASNILAARLQRLECLGLIDKLLHRASAPDGGIVRIDDQ